VVEKDAVEESTRPAGPRVHKAGSTSRRWWRNGSEGNVAGDSLSVANRASRRARFDGGSWGMAFLRWCDGWRQCFVAKGGREGGANGGRGGDLW
jgi:hypothetical protein